MTKYTMSDAFAVAVHTSGQKKYQLAALGGMTATAFSLALGGALFGRTGRERLAIIGQHLSVPEDQQVIVMPDPIDK